MTILDRYLLQKFFTPFIYCLFGFLGIWFIFDLSDNLPDFIQGRAGPGILAEYYASQIPQIIVISLPIALLLAILYSLTAMSRSNEIISMLGAGLSVTRVLIPLFCVGLLLTGISAVFNYRSAPHAAETKKQMLKEIKRGEKRQDAVYGHLFRNREDSRTWFMRRINYQNKKMGDIQILQQNAKGDITKKWYASSADFDPATKSWTLFKALYVETNPEGLVIKSEPRDQMVITGWSETPQRILGEVMNPDFMAADELRDYLSYNSDLPVRRLAAYRTQEHYRWALPWFSMVVVLLAAPMGVVYSRRGVLGGVAVAIGLFFSMVFLSSLFVALGKGSRIPPGVAAWGPVVSFAAIGIWLLWFRSTNRDLPKIKIPGF